MTRAARFSQADATRALKAVIAAGGQPRGLIVEPDGTIRISLVDEGPAGALRNPLDRVLPR